MYLNHILKESIIEKVISDEIIERIEYTISSSIADNAMKQRIIEEEMTKAGFDEFKAGTNRICCFHPGYPDKIFKIAIDKRGIADNLADIELFKDKDLTEYVTVLYESIGSIEVSERVKGLRSTSEMDEKFKEVADILRKVGSKFLLDDVWIDQFMNWGYSSIKNHMVILDYAYLFRKDRLDLHCVKMIDGSRCNGDLKYTTSMTEMVCRKCGRVYTFGELKDRAINHSVKEGDAISLIGNLETL